MIFCCIVVYQKSVYDVTQDEKVNRSRSICGCDSKHSDLEYFDRSYVEVAFGEIWSSFRSTYRRDISF